MTQTNIPVYTKKEEKIIIENAGKKIGMTKSGFCRTAALEKANKILEDNSQINKTSVEA